MKGIIDSVTGIAITVFLAVLAIEFLARVYIVIKLRDAYYLIYGEEQFRRLWKSFFNKWRKKSGSPAPVISTFGGSTTRWEGIAEKYNYSEILGRLAQVKIVNCGGEGMDSFGELDSLKQYLSIVQHKPAAVFIYSGLNDAINARHFEKNISRQELDAYIGKGPLEVDILTRFKGAVKQSSILYCMFRNASLKKSKIKLNALGREAFLKSRIEKFGKNIEQMIDLCRKDNIHVYFGTVPLAEDYKKDHSEFANLLKSLYVELFRICKEKGAGIIDIDSEVYKLPKLTRDKLFVRDGIHMNLQGNEFIAKIIYERVKNNGLLLGSYSKKEMVQR